MFQRSNMQVSVGRLLQVAEDFSDKRTIVF